MSCGKLSFASIIFSVCCIIQCSALPFGQAETEQLLSEAGLKSMEAVRIARSVVLDFSGRRGGIFDISKTFRTITKIAPESHQCEKVGRQIILEPLAMPQCKVYFQPVFGCSGTCHSSSEPQYSPTLKNVVVVRKCSCCRPSGPVIVKWKLGEMICEETYRNKTVMNSKGLYYYEFPMVESCSCRPCSDGEPVGETPYK